MKKNKLLIAVVLMICMAATLLAGCAEKELTVADCFNNEIVYQVYSGSDNTNDNYTDNKIDATLDFLMAGDDNKTPAKPFYCFSISTQNAASKIKVTSVSFDIYVGFEFKNDLQILNEGDDTVVDFELWIGKDIMQTVSVDLAASAFISSSITFSNFEGTWLVEDAGANDQYSYRALMRILTPNWYKRSWKLTRVCSYSISNLKITIEKK